jgi:hypothetical protein
LNPGASPFSQSVTESTITTQTGSLADDADATPTSIESTPSYDDEGDNEAILLLAHEDYNSIGDGGERDDEGDETNEHDNVMKYDQPIVVTKGVNANVDTGGEKAYLKIHISFQSTGFPNYSSVYNLPSDSLYARQTSRGRFDV